MNRQLISFGYNAKPTIIIIIWYQEGDGIYLVVRRMMSEEESVWH